MVCKKKHRHDPFFAELKHDQSDPYRHRCAGCAYELGVQKGENGEQNHFVPEEVDFSQARYVRHKAAEEAFELGYQDGLKNRE